MNKAHIRQRIRALVEDHQAMISRFLSQSSALLDCAVRACTVFKKGGKLVFFGNGGSAADAQHLAAEFVCRFMKNRKSLPAIALTVNTSLLTAIGNDFSFEELFSRQIESLVQPRDMVIAISTSGSSPNIVKGIREAKKRGANTAGFTSMRDTTLWKMVDISVRIPSLDTPRIQEGHVLAGHILCALIEETLFP